MSSIDAVKLALITNTVPNPNVFPVREGSYAVWLENIDDRRITESLTRGSSAGVLSLTREHGQPVLSIHSPDGAFKLTLPKGDPNDWVHFDKNGLLAQIPADGTLYSTNRLLCLRANF